MKNTSGSSTIVSAPASVIVPPSGLVTTTS